MCGFVGVVGSEAWEPPLAQLRAARDTLTHRGPDSAGEFTDDRAYLGFRRLAILDTSPSGDQPMADPEKGLWIVLNGEIYNYLELRKDCEARGAVFRTRTDTEVVLWLYRLHGVRMLDMLNGMFALAIYDVRAHRLVLARDRFGKKPLFYYLAAGRLAFASETKALRPLPDFPSEVSAEALNLYFRLGWVPGTHCVFSDVRKLPPSSWLEYDIASGTLVPPRQYWGLGEAAYDFSKSDSQWLSEIEELLADAVRIRLRSDVPVGSFLSGGIDSGLVTAMAATATDRSISALNVAFPGWAGDESALAAATAQKLGVSCITRAAAPTFDLTLLRHFDEPFADSSAHPTSLVCAVARESVTVALSGDGGDETFAGYPHHLRARQWRGLERLPLGLRKGASRLLTAVVPADGRAHRFGRRLAEPVPIFGLGCTSYPFGQWLRHYLEEPYHDESALGRMLADTPGWPIESRDPLDAAQRFDLRSYMVDDILVKVDRMSMLHSLEVRSPFLDYRLVELALRIPPALRLQGGRSKGLLRGLAERHLPPAVVSAPKRGFGIPLRTWLFHAANTAALRDLLHAQAPGFPSVVPGARIDPLWRAAAAGDELATALVYRLLAYRVWAAGNA